MQRPVVICLKISIFALAETILIIGGYQLTVLWFA